MSKDETNLDPETVRALEAILMVAMEPVAPALLAQLLEISQATVESLCERLATTYESAGHGFQLVKVAVDIVFNLIPIWRHMLSDLY